MFGNYQNLISLQYNSAGLFRFLLVPIRGNDIVALVPTTTHFLYQSLGSVTDMYRSCHNCRIVFVLITR